MYTYGIHIVYRFYPLTYKLKRMINLEIVFNYGFVCSDTDTETWNSGLQAHFSSQVHVRRSMLL